MTSWNYLQVIMGTVGIDGNRGFQQFPGPGNSSCLPIMLLESSTWPQQEESLALVCAHSISPQNFAPSLGQCSSERCWVRTPNYSLPVSLLYPYLFCAHQNSRIKKPYQQFFLASEKHCIQKIWVLQEAAFCFSLKVTVTKQFKEHFQPKTNKQKNQQQKKPPKQPNPMWWEA